MDKHYIGTSRARRVRGKGKRGQMADFKEAKAITYGEANTLKDYELLRNDGFMQWLCAAYTNFKLHQTDAKN